VFASNAEVYGRKYGNGMCYKCTACDSYVGVHNGTKEPLGRLANKELRTLKVECHNLFDPIWKGPYKTLQRTAAYTKLAELLGIRYHECHFGWFDKAMLLRCIEILEDPDWWVRKAEQA